MAIITLTESFELEHGKITLEAWGKTKAQAKKRMENLIAFYLRGERS